MRQHIDFEQIKCVVLASPGFVKDEFLEYVLAEGVRRDARDIIEHKSKFLCCHSSSGHKHSLQEALSDPGVAAQLSDTKAAGEVRALADFNTMMGEDPDRAYYGPNHVRKAAEMGAIHTLLILDELFRSTDVVVRRQWVQMTEEVEAAGGLVFVFSSMHLSGQQLKNISGVAALLRFPMPEIVSSSSQQEPSSLSPGIVYARIPLSVVCLPAANLARFTFGRCVRVRVRVCANGAGGGGRGRGRRGHRFGRLGGQRRRRRRQRRRRLAGRSGYGAGAGPRRSGLHVLSVNTQRSRPLWGTTVPPATNKNHLLLSATCPCSPTRPPCAAPSYRGRSLLAQHHWRARPFPAACAR